MLAIFSDTDAKYFLILFEKFKNLRIKKKLRCNSTYEQEEKSVSGAFRCTSYDEKNEEEEEGLAFALFLKTASFPLLWNKGTWVHYATPPIWECRGYCFRCFGNFLVSEGGGGVFATVVAFMGVGFEAIHICATISSCMPWFRRVGARDVCTRVRLGRRLIFFFFFGLSSIAGLREKRIKEEKRREEMRSEATNDKKGWRGWLVAE